MSEEQIEDSRQRSSNESSFSEQTDQPQPENISPTTIQPADMEVHHHGHVHENKKWKEYVFQFFMLFLAVLCGSLAEYKLEHIIEHNREKEYITSLLHDLKQDTAAIADVIRNNGSHIQGMDQLISFSKKNLTDANDLRNFYDLNFKDLSGFAVFKNNEATLSQLKFSGGLRLIKTAHAADSIASYDAALSNSMEQRQLYVEAFKNLWTSQQQILDLTMLADTSFIKTFQVSTLSLQPITASKDQMKLYYNQVMIYKIATIAYNNYQLKPLLNHATRLITYLKKEYPGTE